MIKINHLYEKIQTETSSLGLDVFCYKLVDLVLNSPVNHPVYTYAALTDAVGGCDIENLQRAINYLKSSPINLFVQQYQYMDVEGVPYDISREDLQAAILDDALCHPENGLQDRDFRERVYVLYVADKAVIQL
ncbi:hypothetical protein [Pseudomonas protegens]|uniref:hypothetical protein n=1 Tax=Pseudomonas protegens TaxID=380021 RepID=UPI001F459A00|nr:hypothetical protein [Pseudomonas protegens]